MLGFGDLVIWELENHFFDVQTFETKSIFVGEDEVLFGTN